MKKFTKITAALLVANLCFPYFAAENHFAIAEGTDGITVYSLYPTKDNVIDFCMWLDDIDMSSADRALLNDVNNCYWIRTIPKNPNGTSIEDLWLMLYKDSNTGATLLGFENKVTLEDKVVRFTGNDGGLGVTSLALGDLNNDGWNEIYFTYSWDPGTYCSQAGYFDTKTSDVHYFGDYMCPDSELVFTSENNTLTVSKAEVKNYKDKVHFELESKESIGEIVCKDGEIAIEPLSDDFIKLEEKLEPTPKPIPDWLPKNVDEAHTFMDENGGFSINDGYICRMIKDSYICGIVYIHTADSYRANKISLSEKSDVNAPVSYNKYEDEYYGEYIVSCFEMQPDSYLEIYDSEYKTNQHYSYISDENGNVNEVFKGDVNKDGKVNIADLVVLQKWLLGNSDSLDCWQLADIYDDNQINAFDMVMPRKLITGSI